MGFHELRTSLEELCKIIQHQSKQKGLLDCVENVTHLSRDLPEKFQQRLDELQKIEASQRKLAEAEDAIVNAELYIKSVLDAQLAAVVRWEYAEDKDGDRWQYFRGDASYLIERAFAMGRSEVSFEKRMGKAREMHKIDLAGMKYHVGVKLAQEQKL